MQEFLTSILFAFIQGVTEFLPVSSSGHLVILGYFFKDINSLSFDVLLHLATFFSVVIFFWKDVLSLFKEKWRMAVNIFIGTIPAGLAGILLKDPLEKLFDEKHMQFLSLSFLITSFLVFVAGRKIRGASSPEEGKEIGIKEAFLIGLFQALAIVPGISRSGATISSAVLLGVSPKKAFVFSFLLSLPAIAGAAFLELIDMEPGMIKIGDINLVASLAVAFLTGLGALFVLRSAIMNRHYRDFSFYTILLSVITLVLYFRG